MVNYQKTEEAFRAANYSKYQHEGNYHKKATITHIRKRKDGLQKYKVL